MLVRSGAKVPTQAAGVPRNTAMLQRTVAPARERNIGNQAMLRLSAPAAPAVQAKLAVGAVDDPLEHEADSMADRVMGMSDSAASGCPACADNEARGTLVQRQADGGVAAPDDEQDPGIIDFAGLDAESIQGAAGEPLRQADRAFMESRFGYDFAAVRVHSGPRASGMARSVGARAFAFGTDIVFGDSAYQPGTADGRRLLAHELTHVVQQNAPSGEAAPARKRIQRYLSGPPRRVNAITQVPPTYGSCRAYAQAIAWDTDVRDGFILQEITKGGSAAFCSGRGIATNTPHFWEAWRVSAGTVSNAGL
ncbi:MAG: DUF4157 domain-containing protein, partial [Acetobacteraceae bacterium]